MRSKRMSIVTSKTMSVISTPIIAGLALVTLSRVQVFASGDHAERSYGSQVSLVDFKQSKLKIHLYDSCNTAKFIRHSPIICRRYLP